MGLTKLLSVAALLAGSLVNAELPSTLEKRSDGSYESIQSPDTPILGQYGHSEPVYPSPKMKETGEWADALKKARNFVAELTLDEKALMVTGQPGPCIGNIAPITRMNFSGLCLQDGPASLRTADFVSVFPSGVTLASSWDRDIIYSKSHAQGSEFRGKGAHIALAPVSGPLGRSVYGGRNWEGFSPDPYLTGVAMEEAVRGFQDAGVQATAKHYILNEQETARGATTNFSAISSNVDDRTIHELYLWPFANAVRANVASVMCSYNRINGSYACQNSKILNGLLKTELGFQGYVMSDWGGTMSGVAAIKAGEDMDMPGFEFSGTFLEKEGLYASKFGGNVTKAVSNETISTDRLDDMISRIMTPYYYLKQDEGFPLVDPSSDVLNTMGYLPVIQKFQLGDDPSRDVRENHGELIRKWAAESTILLKNERNALPLQKPRTIAVYGSDAGEIISGPLNQDDYTFGTIPVGGGSGAGRFSYLVTPLDALKARAREYGAVVAAWQNNTQVIEEAKAGGNGPIGTGNGNFPYVPDVCLVFVKTWISEGVDRQNLEFEWDGAEMVEAVASGCNNTIVVSHSSGVNDMPFASHPNVTAILLAHYPGQESGNSLADVLFGDVNPSAKLPYTVAKNVTDYPDTITTGIKTNGTDDWQAWFEEKLHIDYRYFDANNIDVLYEFGFGLSYTTFEMIGLSVMKSYNGGDITSMPQEQATIAGGNPDLWTTLYSAQVTVRNSGLVAGKAVAQLYVTFPEGTTPEGTPPRQLRGFDKLSLRPGQKSTAKFELARRDLSYWDVTRQEWVIPSGEFKLSAGFSSRDLVEFATFTAVNGGEGSKN